MVTGWHLMALVGAAFAAGVVDAIAGGGGLLTLPALLLAGLPVHTALGTNKGQSVFGSGAALLTFARAGRIEPKRVPRLFLPALLGALGGAFAVGLVSPAVLRPVELALLVGVAVLLALRPSLGQQARSVAGHAGLRTVLIALVIGAYDGFFGPGTGTFVILALVAWLGDELVGASAHAKVVNFASNLASVALFVAQGTVLWSVALPMAGAQALGGVVGARLAVRSGEALVRRVVLGLVVCLCARLAWDLLGK